MEKPEHMVGNTGSRKKAGKNTTNSPQENKTSEIENKKYSTEAEKNHAKINEEYADKLGEIEGNNPFFITPWLKSIENKNERVPNPRERFKVEFLQELDTGKRLVRFSKSESDDVSYKFPVTAVQLSDMAKLTYSGFDIVHRSMMHGFVKAVSVYKTN